MSARVEHRHRDRADQLVEHWLDLHDPDPAVLKAAIAKALAEVAPAVSSPATPPPAGSCPLCGGDGFLFHLFEGSVELDGPCPCVSLQEAAA